MAKRLPLDAGGPLLQLVEGSASSVHAHLTWVGALNQLEKVGSTLSLSLS